MEAIIFCGVQAAGKTTFFKEHFFATHVRISYDLLKTRNRETKFLNLCLHTKQKFVVDNTNPTRADREKYIAVAKAHKFAVIGYYFHAEIEDALRRNSLRPGKENIPVVGIRSTLKRLQIPVYDEGYEELYTVTLRKEGFLVEKNSIGFLNIVAERRDRNCDFFNISRLRLLQQL
ncbi:MAG TPA: AAA family ATPase [Patescibacteria group bacterium]|nr:AAA family ATPase [Patescibacteria group bacterium]